MFITYNLVDRIYASQPLIPENVTIHFLLALLLARLRLVCGFFSRSFCGLVSRHGAVTGLSRRSYDLGTEINEAAIIKKRKFMPAVRARPRHFITRTERSEQNE